MLLKPAHGQIMLRRSLVPTLCHVYTQVGQCRDGPRFDKATLLSRVQMQLAELEREMASTKAEVLGSCVTSCNWVSRILPFACLRYSAGCSPLLSSSQSMHLEVHKTTGSA